MATLTEVTNNIYGHNSKCSALPVFKAELIKKEKVKTRTGQKYTALTYCMSKAHLSLYMMFGLLEAERRNVCSETGVDSSIVSHVIPWSTCSCSSSKIWQCNSASNEAKQSRAVCLTISTTAPQSWTIFLSKFANKIWLFHQMLHFNCRKGLLLRRHRELTLNSNK